MNQARGSAVVTLGVLMLWGIIIADIIAHPSGTQAASNAVNTFSKQGFNAMLGKTS